VVVVVIVVVTLGAVGLGGRRDQRSPDSPVTYGTATVKRHTLSLTTSLNGRLDRGPAAALPIRASGTVTWLPPAGTVLGRGDVVLRVDDRPVILMFGAMPAYRSFGLLPPPASEASGAAAGAGGSGTGQATGGAHTEPMTGRDVRQFESNLRALGYGGFTVDDTFSAATAQGVKRWQRDLGVPETGQVRLGDIVYAPAAIRVQPRADALGSPIGDAVVQYTGDRRRVTVQAAADDVGWAVPGTRVTVALPDGKQVAGSVTFTGRDASAGGSDSAGEPNPAGGPDSAGGPGATVPVVIDVADQRSLGNLESGPVTVSYVTQQRRGVLTVPVTALVALAEGGYGIERADAAGGRFVAVTPGMFADGLVEIRGPVTEGLKVRTPS